jgi:integrase
MVKELRELNLLIMCWDWLAEQASGHRNSCVSASFYPTSPFRLGNFAATRRICKIGTLEKDCGLVFTTSVGTPVEYRNVITHFKKVISETGLPNIRFHDLRHTVATLLLSKEINPKIVQEQLGHASINLTLNMYSHVIKSMRGHCC